MTRAPEVVVVGAGLAGLCCGRELAAAGVPFAILEASDGVGGRARTDVVDGFRLDRGLQNYLSSYPEGKRVLDYDALRLRPFARALLVRYRGKFHRLANPRDEFWTAAKSAFNPLGTLRDKFRAAKLNRVVAADTLEAQLATPEETSVDFLRTLGFTDRMIDAVYRPFLSGVFLEPDLATSARFMRFVYRLFGEGAACLPAAGIQAIADQLAAGLPPGCVRLNSAVAAVGDGAVSLATGETLTAKAVVVATDGPAAARLTGGAVPAPGYNGTVTLYYAASASPIRQPVLMLDGDGTGPVTITAVLSDVAPEYAPPGQALIAASVVGLPPDDDATLDGRTRGQLREWFGPAVDGWRLLRIYRIRHALPAQPVGWLEPWRRPVTVRPGLFVCGDHMDNASIDGAMASGRRAARAVLDRLAAE